jgi:hypothetical protein
MPNLQIFPPVPLVDREDIFVSVVAILDATTLGVESFVRSLDEEVGRRYANYEVLLVENGISDIELIDLRSILTQLPCIRVLRLSRRFTMDNAVFAGLEAAIGDYLVVLNPTHDPASAIAKVVRLLRNNGVDIVQGLSTVPLGGTWLGGLTRRCFYWYNRKFLDVDIPSRATQLTGLTRRAVNTLTASTRSQRYLRHLVRHVGYQISDLHYLPVEGPSRKRTVRSDYVEAVEMISSYSTHPLRVVTMLGAVAAFFNLLYAVYVLGISVLVGGVVEGWTTTSLQLSLMFFTIGIVLAIQSEYIGRILAETRNEPSYIIMEEIESETLIADLERRNVSN